MAQISDSQKTDLKEKNESPRTNATTDDPAEGSKSEIEHSLEKMNQNQQNSRNS